MSDRPQPSAIRSPSTQRLARRDFQRILIIKPSSPGDIIHALPVLRALRARYPQAHLAWLVAKPFTNLLEADPALNEIIPFDRAYFGRLGRSWRVTRDFLQYVRALRAKRFDLVIDLQGLVRSGFMSFFTGAADRIGFRESREMAWLFYNHRIPRLPREMHAADKLLALRPLLGLPEDAPPDFRVAISPEDQAAVKQMLSDVGVSPERPFAVLVPGTRWETKRWPAARFGELARVLFERHGILSLLVGSSGDAPDAQQAVTAAGESAGEPVAINLCGRTTFRQLAVLIDRAAIVVTADSAPMHIAAAHGRPLVALFGPTSPVRTGPYGRLDDVVRLALPCSPCYLRRLSQCPFGQACMRDLTVEMAAEAVGRTLGAQGLPVA